jgi:hypothetical protein
MQHSNNLHTKESLIDATWHIPNQAAFQTVNEQGKVTDLPRPSTGVRIWDAETKQYCSVSNKLDGGPANEEAAVAWYQKTVRTLKASPYLGSANVDKLVTSTKHQFDGNTFGYPDAGAFHNKWSELAVATKLE